MKLNLEASIDNSFGIPQLIVEIVDEDDNRAVITHVNLNHVPKTDRAVFGIVAREFSKVFDGLGKAFTA